MKPYEGYINPSSNSAAELKKSLETISESREKGYLYLLSLFVLHFSFILVISVSGKLGRYLSVFNLARPLLNRYFNS